MNRAFGAGILCFFAAAGLVNAQSAPGGQAASAQATAIVAQRETPPTVTLDNLLENAKSGAPGLRSARLALDSAEAQFAQVRAKNGLSVGETGGYFHQGSIPSSSTTTGKSGVVGENLQAGLTISSPSTSVSVSAQQGLTSSGDQSTSLSLSGSQVVYDGYAGGRASGTVREADYTLRAAQVAYDAALKSLDYQIRQAYYVLIGAQDTLSVRQATVKHAEENLAQIRGFFTAQRATKLDVLQVQVTLTQAQLDLKSAQNDIETDRKKLSLIVGLPLDRTYQVADVPVPALPDLDPTKAIETAFSSRSELKTLDLNIASAEIAQALQRSAASPSISLDGSYGYSQAWSTNTGTGSFTAGFSVSLPPLYDGKLQDSLVRQAGNQVDSYKVQRDQTRQSITIDVQSALFGVQDTNDRLALAQKNLEQAQGQYDLDKAKLAAGLVTTLDVLTAFSTLTTAQLGLEQAKDAYILAVLNLDNVMGL
jgi:outer membrane protein TolC